MSYNSRPNNRRSYGGGNNNRRGQSSGNGNRNRGVKGRGQYIDPAKFVRKATPPVGDDAYTPTNTFNDFNIEQILKDNLAEKGYEVPSAIQDQSIPLGLEGRDVIGIADTGTGKTAAFALPVLDRLMNDPHSNAIIVAPTRELAQQIEQELRSIGKNSGLFGVLLIGGTPMGPQLRDLRSRPRVVIGTPGRIKDHLERGTLQLQNFNLVVLDEVDRMLDMGFLPDMQFILDSVSPERQSFFFSATMDAPVSRLIERFSHDAMKVSVKTGDTSEHVNQDVIHFSSKEDKMDKLHDALISEAVKKVIIFDETQRSVERLAQELISRGFATDAIHGGKSQGQRQRALKRFKATEVDILVATDVAARGLDVKDITHVINYAIPQTYQDYTHRVGRAGRAGNTGYALTFVVR
ncbi:DEAD/DEAH box helicase [Candidatus Saccharibacteria bacterium]|jgi:ATP-dependent RNA helicase RhlE|nr:DEAD/DEAH box helicase [Candidatus Saccharibacteria bacterium]